MNERLTALYRASRPKEALASQDEFKSANALLGSDVAKFAELIIQECVNNLEIHSTCFDGDVGRGIKTAARLTKEHFGVE